MIAAKGNGLNEEGEYLAIVKLLVKHKANLDLKDKHGKTALDYAIEGDVIMGTPFVQQKVVDYLCRYDQQGLPATN